VRPWSQYKAAALHWLAFETISAEITVSYEQAEAADELSQTLAMNHEKWGSMIDRPLGRAPTKQL